MNPGTLTSLIGAIIMLIGAFFVFVAAIGLLRFDDLLQRMHAAAKPQTFGTMLLMLGLALNLRGPTTVWALVLVVAFVLVTSPISAHLASRAGFRTGHAPTWSLLVDEYSRDMRRAIAAMQAREAQSQHQGDNSRHVQPADTPGIRHDEQ
ncbi:MAG: monovalent cation/H(+) antiporter subunit G [Bowdeniella nasicola]|nr:monovalent cation/H(+) antiporter subunit G [Bowdeniella nasicola]